MPTIGLILMIIGGAGLILSLLYMLVWAPGRRTELVHRDMVERDPRERPLY